MTFTMFAFVILFGVLTEAVYLEESGSPYDPGSLTGTLDSFLFTPQDHDIPMQVRVDYPAIEEEFAIVVFVSGFGGWVPPILYSDWISQITAHGFITLSPLTLNGGREIVEALQWLEDNMADYLNGTTASWDHVGFACHSAGCADVLDVLQDHEDPNFAKAVFMLEPFATVESEISLPVPGVFFGTNATCNEEGRDYIAVYDQWQDSKIRTGNNMFGHCDFLDEYIVGICKLVCSGGAPADQLAEYRRTTQGMTSSLFIHLLQGRDDVIDYLLDPDMIPLTPTDHDVSQW